MSIAIAIFLFMPAASGLAQDTLSLTVDEAVQRALASNPGLAAARYEAEAAAAARLAATPAFLPSLELSTGGVRTTDPVAVFGFKLRQENFQASDLALDALNRPGAYGGFSSAATVSMPLFAPEGLFGYAAAGRMADARRAVARRMSGAMVYQVVTTYWGIQLATREVETLDVAERAARAHVARAEAMREQGLVTGLDARLARVRAGDLAVRRLAAQARVANARHALAILIGIDPETPVSLRDSLTGGFDTECGVVDGACVLDDRGDLAAAAFGVAAAKAGVGRAWGANLPSVAVFGSFAHHARSSPWSGGSGDWTLGVMVKWNPIRGLSGLGRVREARAQQQGAAAQAEAARRQATLEVESARRSLMAAAERVEVAAAADAEAREALAQADLRYRQTLAPITELLDVEAATTLARLNLYAARHDLFVARAALDFAYGVFDR